jgi:hypothetical protein
MINHDRSGVIITQAFFQLFSKMDLKRKEKGKNGDVTLTDNYRKEINR